jgi:CheY-like chemotaxis protein
VGQAKKIKILIAEDDRISTEYLKELLKSCASEILLARNGKEAVRLCKEHPDIDLVLMDIKMPEMNGKEATQDIKAIRPSLPIIAQTAYALDNERETILHEGFDAYIAKPIQRHDIMSVIDKLLNKS